MALFGCCGGFILAQNNWLVDAIDHDGRYCDKAMMMAIWRRPQAVGVLVYTDQGSQYASGDYREFLAVHNLKPSKKQWR
jgi:transposase InsO family protein